MIKKNNKKNKTKTKDKDTQSLKNSTKCLERQLETILQQSFIARLGQMSINFALSLDITDILFISPFYTAKSLNIS